MLQRQIPPSALAAAAVVVLALMGHWLQSGTHLNHDVSYFVHFDTWLLQGRSLGDDLFDGNLPMVWLLFMPAGALAHFGVMGEAAAVRLMFWAYFLLSTALLAHVVGRLGREDRAASIGWIGAFVLVSTLAPGFAFGQREHASVLFAMPYLAMAVSRVQGGRTPGFAALVCIGVLAGIGFTIKPHFLAVPALVELWLMARLGIRRQIVRTEFVAFCLTTAIYVAAAALLLHDYLVSRVGLTLATYWAYETAPYGLLLERYTHVALPAFFGLAIALLTRSWRAHHTAMLLAGLGYTLCYFVQRKGFVYHAYPIVVCATTLLGICAADGIFKTWGRWQRDRRAIELVVIAVSAGLTLIPLKIVHDDVARWYFSYNVSWGPNGQFRQAVIDAVNQLAPDPGSYFYAFSTHPFPGFPTASYTAAEWSGSSIHQPFIPAIARRDEVQDPVVRSQIDQAARLLQQRVIEDFERRPPRIVFVENGPLRLGLNGRRFDDVAFYLEDPRFRQIWANYREAAPMGPLRVFVLDTAPQRPAP